MINDETIKSLYNDKPTLLEWLKRVEAQLEELKKITNFDTLTANNVEVTQKLDTQNIHAGKGELDELLVKGNPVAKAIYVHKISWKYVSNSPNVYLSYLSTNPTPYSSKADIFSHKNETSLSNSELIEYGDKSAIVKFSPTGAVLNALAIDSTSHGGVDTFAMDPNAFDFVKDEVIGDWGV